MKMICPKAGSLDFCSGCAHAKEHEEITPDCDCDESAYCPPCIPYKEETVEKCDFSKARKGDRVWGIYGPPVKVGETNGEIEAILASIHPIHVSYGNGTSETYTADGFRCHHDSAPSLFWSRPQVIGGTTPPKRMVKKKIEFWMNIYAHGPRGPYDNKDDADFGKCANRITCQRFETEIEVPE